MRRNGIGRVALIGALGLLFACGGATTAAPDGGGNSQPGVSVSETCDQNAQPFCCSGGCNGDLPAAEVLCENGTWKCPPGSVTASECPSDEPFCAGGQVGDAGP